MTRYIGEFIKPNQEPGKTPSIITINTDLKSELSKAISSNSDKSDYRFDLWINPRQKPSCTQGVDCFMPHQREEANIDFSKKRPRLSVRRIGPEGIWRVAGFELPDCQS